MYVDTIPNRNSPPCILVRDSYREGGKVKKYTVANLTGLPEAAIEAVRRSLRGESLISAQDGFEILRARPHGHVAAVLGTMRKLGMAKLLSTRKHRKRQLVLAMIAARLIEPDSKLATARALNGDTLTSSLSEELGVEWADADDLYEALDWLIRGQARIEKKLARRHLEEGQLVLWDVSPVPFESHTCELTAYGRPRGGKSVRQLLFGLMTTPEGLPVAVEAFRGNTGDPRTLGTALDRAQERFGLKRVVVVGDRGMVTQARIDEELRPRDLDWITSLRAPTIQKLYREGPLQLSLFDQQDLAEISSPDFPGERLVCCRNPLLAEERTQKREALLQATEEKLEEVAAATWREKRRLKGKDAIGVRVGKVLGKSKVAKHFRYEITEEGFSFERDESSIQKEADLDGIYVIRTSVSAEEMEAEAVVTAYKDLSEVERAFRISKDFALEVEPIRHRREDRVRAHVFLCMLALYVYRHMEEALAPMLFVDHDREGGEARRASIVAPAQRSKAALRKVHRQRDEEGRPIHAFRSLLRDLATLTRNTVQVERTEHTFEEYARPTELQQRALDLLGVSPRL